MKKLRLLIFPFIFLGCAAPDSQLAENGASEGAVVRYVEYNILSGGVILFQAGTCDDGTSSVDEVWAGISEMKFQPTKALLEESGRQIDSEFYLLTVPEQSGSIELVAPGGRVEFQALLLSFEDGGWLIAAEDLNAAGLLR